MSSQHIKPKLSIIKPDVASLAVSDLKALEDEVSKYWLGDNRARMNEIAEEIFSRDDIVHFYKWITILSEKLSSKETLTARDSEQYQVIYVVKLGTGMSRLLKRLRESRGH
jgi:hypothetical protein